MMPVIHEWRGEAFDAPADAFLVFVLRGAFCPPHQGHWEVVEAIMDKYPEAILILNQCDQTRHGVAVDTAKHILQTFIKDSIFRDRLWYRFHETLSVIVKKWFASPRARPKPHSFVILRGYEPTRTFSDEHYQKRYKTIARYLRRKQIGLVMIQNQRGRFSSTRFMALLRKEVTDCNNDGDPDALSFLPAHLSEQTREWTLQTLLSEDHTHRPITGS